MEHNFMAYSLSIATPTGFRPGWGGRRRQSSMSYVARVQSALNKRPTEKLTAHEVATLANITETNFQRHAADMVENGHISRAKRKGDTCYRYFLSEDQLEAYIQRAGVVASDDDTWIKVTPDTLPESLEDVDLYIEGHPYYDGRHIERGFYDAHDNKWFSNHGGAPLDSGCVVTWWRKGSLPPGAGCTKVTS